MRGCGFLRGECHDRAERGGGISQRKMVEHRKSTFQVLRSVEQSERILKIKNAYVIMFNRILVLFDA